MNRSRKSCLLLLVIFGSPILLFFIYLFVSLSFPVITTYYIPQLDMYVKTIEPREKFGYILFGNNPDISLSDTVDYICVYKNISNSVIINPNNKDTIWFCSQIKKDVLNEGQYTIMNKPKEINQKKYVIINGTNETDTIFFRGEDSFKIPILRKPYFEISVVDNFYYILLRQDSTTIKIEPLK